VDYDKLFKDLKRGIKEEGEFDFSLYQEGNLRKKKDAPTLSFDEVCIYILTPLYPLYICQCVCISPSMSMGI
jgi:hypothetical protein